MSLAFGLAMLVSAALGNPQDVVAAPPMKPAQTVEQYVRSYFADIPVMQEISHCESKFRQYDQNGDVLRGEHNNHDVGVMQINEDYHLKEAKAMGIDLYTIEGNVEYARFLYEREGSTPWLSSGACWKVNTVSKVAVK